MSIRSPFLVFSQTVRRNPGAWALFGGGAFLPFVVFGCAGFFGAPDWRHSWFDPFQVPLLILGLGCCLVAPWLSTGTALQRLARTGGAVVGFGVATLAAAIAAFLVFGPPID